MGILLDAADISKSGECIECLRCVSICPRDNVSLRVSADKSDLKPVVTGVAVVSIMTGLYFAGTLVSDHMTAFPVSPTVTGSESVSTSAAPQVSSSDQNGESTPTSSPSNETSAATSTNTVSKYKDGTYQGTGIGYSGGRTVVSVKIAGGKISDITVLSKQDTPQYFSYAAPIIIKSIINSQSSHVNAVSGATYTSNGIMQAVTDALSKALNG